MQPKIKSGVLVRSLLAAAVICSVPFTASAADGTINFTGSILDSACTVNTISASQTVNLGNLQRSVFKAAGDVASATRFDIVLENCPDTVTSASVKFDGTANATNSNILALNSGQTAQGVGVALFEEDGVTAIPLSTPSAQMTLVNTGDTNRNVMTFVAKYQATQAAVTAGTANATSDFTIVYQ
ncbi:fimbrial protein [Enterobacter sp. JJBC]|uniref:fimbrial protein n=1 Tax=Enterobacter sp. JJBC TaxID=3080020 RepID=UPI0030D4D781